MKRLTVPFSDSALSSLKAGQEVLLSGVIFTARDQAHLRFDKLLQRGNHCRWICADR